jgi:hypothetical protein
MAFTLSMFAAITVQKNTRDSAMNAPKNAVQMYPHDSAEADLSA